MERTLLARLTTAMGFALTLALAAPVAAPGAPLLNLVDELADRPVDGLLADFHLAVSPDGKHVYATGLFDFAVAVFSRNAFTGELEFVEMQKDGVGGVDGLAGADGVAVSPDGKNVYVAGLADNAVAVFSRDATSGKLTFVEVQRDGVAGVDGLAGAEFVALSPDGKNLYVIGTNDNALAVFTRDSLTGALTFLEFQQDGVAGVDGLASGREVVVSPDGNHVYATGFNDNAVVVFSRDSLTGALTFVEFQQDGVGGVDGLAGAIGVSISPDGSHVYVAGNTDDAVAVFSRNATTGSLTFVEFEKDGVGGVDGLSGAEDVTVSADGTHLYATGFDDNAVAVFSRNPTSGAISFVEVEKDGVGGVDGLAGAVGVVVSPDNKHVYVCGAADSSVAVFTRNAGTGALAFIEFERDGVSPADGIEGAAAVAGSPDGAHLYVVGSTDNAVAVFSRDAISGALALLETKKDGVAGVDGLAGASGVAVSPDGKNVYVTGATDDAVAVFSRNDITGALTFVEVKKDGVGGVDGLDGASGVVVSPDGAHVYVTGAVDNAVAVFGRNTMTGALTFVQFKKDGVGGVDGLAGASAAALSSDGKHLYVSGAADNSVAVFSRNAVNGMLTYLEFFQDGIGGVNGLGGASDVAVSADGADVYVSGSGDNGLAVFSRDAATGLLTFVEVQVDGVAGVDGLGGASGVAVSPDGVHVYATGATGNGLAVFKRNASTGALTFAEAEHDEMNGVGGLGGASAVAVSADGVYVYATGAADNAVVAFSRFGMTCTGEPVTGCRAPAESQKATLLLKNNTDDSRDQLRWNWRKGTATTLANFGTPTSTTSYALCVFDKSGLGGADKLRLGARAPAAGLCAGQPCWKTRGTTGFKYSDLDLTPSGMRTVILTAGASSQAKVIAKGRGANLLMPALPLSPAVTVQLHALNGECWTATYGAPTRNDSEQFRSKAN